MALANRKPGELNYGSPVRARRHIWPVSCSVVARTWKLVHVPYAGASAAMLDLIAGRLTFTFGTVNVQLPQVKAGKIRARSR